MVSTDSNQSSNPPPPNEVEQSNTFFDVTPPKDWSHTRFAAYCCERGLDVEPKILNFRYTKALRRITNDKSQTKDRRRKAQSLLDIFRHTACRKLCTVPSTRVKIAHSNFTNNDCVNIDGNVTIAGNVTKRRRVDEGDESDESRPGTPNLTGDASAQALDLPSSQESAFVYHATILDKNQVDSPATVRERCPSFACSKRTIVFEDPPSLGGPQAPIGILDPENSTLKLTRPEKEELKKACTLPSFEKPSCAAVDRFLESHSGGDKLSNLRKLVHSSPYGDEVYDRTKHAEATYVNQAAGAILSMIENLKSCHWLGHQTLQEGWYAANVRAPIIDRCFQTLDNCTFSRTEIKSRTDFGENKRFDGIVAALAAKQVAEFGAIEVAKSPEMIPVDKEIHDNNKLTVVLGSMLRELLMRVDYDMEVGRGLCVVGIQHIGTVPRAKDHCSAW